MKFYIFVLSFILISSSVFSLGKKEKMNESQPSPVENSETAGTGNEAETGAENTAKILGKIQIYGSEPHTFVGIIDENGREYAVYPPSQEENLRKLQGHLIEFTVILLDEPQGYGSLFLKGETVTPVSWKVIQ